MNSGDKIDKLLDVIMVSPSGETLEDLKDAIDTKEEENIKSNYDSFGVDFVK